MQMGMKMTVLAATLAASQAGAEQVNQVSQPTVDAYPFETEMTIIEDTRNRALATCDDNYQSRLIELRAVVDQGVISDREDLIAIIEDMGAPDGEVDENTDRELLQAAGSMVGTNKATCEARAHGEAGDSLQALTQMLSENVAVLGTENANFDHYEIALNGLEAFANGDAAILQELAGLRATLQDLRADFAAIEAERVEVAGELVASNEQLAALNEQLAASDARIAAINESIAAAQGRIDFLNARIARNRALVAQNARAIEAIWADIGADT
jgi:hypothetical protein